ncbi:chromate efflux transporter [Adhaeribacter soli]|uniref:chromate efflux transporter n=1 Tax=Adhaeribacter soli TaxID=2607655 RepID=UPI001CDA06F9|nr:chromate efflux transporter [Adhaeribacter soli]
MKQSYLKIFLRFLKFGFLAWGGPVAQIAMIREELVEQEKWVTGEHFNRTLAIYQALPGPEAHELCVFFGMVAGGRWGGFLAGLGFMLPGFLLMLLFSWIYLQFGISDPTFNAVFKGFQAAVIALIFFAVHRIGKHALSNKALLAIAILSAFASLLKAPFYLVLPVASLLYVLAAKGKRILAILLGAILIAFSIYTFSQTNRSLKKADNVPANRQISRPVKTEAAKLLGSGLKAGLLTFGGAYTAIPFVQEDAVERNGWLSNEQFLDGIALSGILPAPLIIFSTFVGFLAGGWLGAILMTIGVFLPAFSFTLIGHNYLERIIQNKGTHHFLDGMTAGVVGLIAVTALELFRTTITSWQAVLIFAGSWLLLYTVKGKGTVVLVILGSGLAGFLWHLFS